MPRGKFFWDSLLVDINWRKAWLCPTQFCISNKIREIHFKILHNIYPCNALISRFAEVDEKCTFCSDEPETILHLFCICSTSSVIWRDMEKFIYSKTKQHITIRPIDIISKFSHSDKAISFILNLMILIGKFHIHKCKYSRSLPNFNVFMNEFKIYIDTLKLMSNKKSERTLSYLQTASITPE